MLNIILKNLNISKDINKINVKGKQINQSRAYWICYIEKAMAREQIKKKRDMTSHIHRGVDCNLV